MNAAKSNVGKLKIAHAIFALALLAGAGGYGWHLYSLFRDAQVNMPQPRIEKLVTDLRLFHSRGKRFPKNFAEINDLIWHTRPMPDYGAEGRQARVGNYYYFYTRVSEHQCAIWAIPLGPRRDDGPTFFLVLAPDWLRSWKGRSLAHRLIPALPAVPALEQLAEWGMRETTDRSLQ